MIGDAFVKPDITLMLDADGVIRKAEASEALADEGVGALRGRSWTDTIDPAVTEQIRGMIEGARNAGVSSCFRVQQKLPSGKELPFEYTTFSLGHADGFVAVGKNLQGIADLQARLQAAQRERERDYWKFREIETRYKMLFDASAEPAVIVRASNMRIFEANVAATRSLGLLPGPEFCPDLAPRDRRALEAMLDKARELGRAPGIAIRLPSTTGQWRVRASLISTDSETFYLIQMSPLGTSAPSTETAEDLYVERLLKRLPDGFVVIDAAGSIVRANNTFLDLIQIGAETSIIGQSIKRWLSHPGADITLLLDLLSRHGNVRQMSTMIYGELGSNTPVEISAIGDRTGAAEFVGLLLRDVTTRISDARQAAPFDFIDNVDAMPDDFSLEKAVRNAVEVIEQKAILSVLRLCRGNRTAAAKRLGLSRQSLHAKLKKYDLDEN